MVVSHVKYWFSVVCCDIILDCASPLSCQEPMSKTSRHNFGLFLLLEHHYDSSNRLARHDFLLVFCGVFRWNCCRAISHYHPKNVIKRTKNKTRNVTKYQQFDFSLYEIRLNILYCSFSLTSGFFVMHLNGHRGISSTCTLGASGKGQESP